MTATSTTFGATIMPFLKAGYPAPDLLPLIPPGASLGEGSTVKPFQLGKIPGRFSGGQWWGLGGHWPTLGLSNADQTKAQNWPTENVGLRAADFPAIDCDVQSEEALELVDSVVARTLGFAPVRIRSNAPRALYVFKRMGEDAVRKMKIVFNDGVTDHAVEVLGAGQQYVISGMHPSGVLYTWSERHELVNVGVDGLTPHDAPDFARFIDELRQEVEGRGWMVKSQTQARAVSGGVVEFPVTTMDPVIEPELVLAALNVIPNTEQNYPDRGDFIAMCASFKAALGREAEQHREAFYAWATKHGWASPEWVDNIWDSLITTRVAPEHIFKEARKFGFIGDALADFAGDPPDPSPTPSETQSSVLPDWLVEMNRKYALLSGEGCSARMNILVLGPDGGFRLEENAKVRDELRNRSVIVGMKNDIPQTKPIFDAWMQHPHRRTYSQGLKFMPGKAPEVDGYFNTWRGWGVKPAPGEWSTIEYHLRKVLCGGNDEVYEYVLSWLALRYQRPHRAMGVCLVFRSGHGVGKSTVGRWLREISGDALMVVTQTDQLTGRFTPHLRDKHLIIAEEAIYSGNHAIRGPLKSLITDPTLTVEGKFLPVQQVPNSLGLIMFSNEAWVAPVELGDRRFMVVECSEKQEAAYYDRLYAKQSTDGVPAPDEIPAFLHALLTRDISGFDVWGFPKTEERSEQIAQTLTGADRVVYEMLRTGAVPQNGHIHGLLSEKKWEEKPILIPKADVRTSMRHHSDAHLRGRTITDREIAKALERAGARGKKASLHNGERISCWELPKLSDAREAFCTTIGAPLRWDDES